MNSHRSYFAAGFPLLFLALAAAPAGIRWGAEGHMISGGAAARTLPEAMPAFFRAEPDHLAWLNPEPDRWRSDSLAVMDRAWKYDHYIDIEVVPEGALSAVDRFHYLRALEQAGLEMPERDAGLLPFRMLELYQRLTTGFRQWREADNRTRPWIEQRILNDAGILGHYVADAANPLHTSVHHNGWNEDFANPHGFPTDRTLHWRFEGVYVRTHLLLDDVLPHVRREARALTDPRADILAYIRESHSHLEALYRLEAAEPFGEETSSARHREFVVQRLAFGAAMLRDLWWSAWLDSAKPD